MNVRFPLSLKVTLWLLLNLFLLAAVAIAFLVVQGGLSWDSLVAGPPGDRLHALANVVAGEVSAASADGRDAILARFSKAYGADFLVLTAEDRDAKVVGERFAIPDAVRQRIEEGPDLRRPGRPPFFLPLGREDIPPATGFQAPPPQRHPGGRLRFVLHTGDPTAWWIGLRIPLLDADRRPAPAILLIRAPSFWKVVLLLNLETWVLVALSVLVFSILFWLPLVRSITHQLRALSAATERIADGRFETRVPATRRDELGRLGASVNTMAARLDTLVNGQKRFLADIAHELGSPLARLQVATEILESRAGPELRDHIGDVREEVQQMATLVNELLAFTKAGLRPRDIPLTRVPVDELLAKALAQESGADRVQRLTLPGLAVLGDEMLLLRAVGNLVRNAVRYAGDSATIVLSVRRDQDQAVITIEDDGPGVPPDALERLGEPFYRPEFARARETGGAGLGLAIVRSSISACGGEIRFSNRTPHGFRAEIRLAAA